MEVSCDFGWGLNCDWEYDRESQIDYLLKIEKLLVRDRDDSTGLFCLAQFMYFPIIWEAIRLLLGEWVCVLDSIMFLGCVACFFSYHKLLNMNWPGFWMLEPLVWRDTTVSLTFSKNDSGNTSFFIVGWLSMFISMPDYSW